MSSQNNVFNSSQSARSYPRNRGRHWCFTLNNPTEAEKKEVTSIDCRYIIFSQEHGDENQTPHLQGYLEFSTQKRFSALKRLPGLSRAHFEYRRGSRKQAKEYCQKDPTAPVFEKGDFASGGQGSRTDLAQLVVDFGKHSDYCSLLRANPAAIRYPRAYSQFTAAKDLLEAPEYREVKVLYFFGAPGTGKTRLAVSFPDYFKVDDFRNLWFDGYVSQDLLILDDFYSSLPYSFVLKLLDVYKLRLNVKGSFTYARWTKIIITSNVTIDDQYKGVPDRSAFLRRVHKIVSFPQTDSLDVLFDFSLVE